MTRLALCLLLALSGAVGTHGAEPPAKPNVLLVLVDDAGYGDFGCHGHPFLKTPHIDRLHGESVRLTDFHVAPMCSPTRGQLLTGCHGLRTGVTSVTAGRTFLRPEFPTAAQMFSAAGYRTGIFGKWHLGDSYPHRPVDKGFQHAVWTKGWGFTSAPEFSNTLTDGRIVRGAEASRFKGYITDALFDEAMAWMRARREAREPFFCYLPLHAAHAPHIVPERFSAPYEGRGAARFFGMMANIDENMGRLEAFLRDSGLRENTIVIFLTDNGGTAGVRIFNAGLRAGKVTYYDGGHRVPCFVRWPAGGLRAPGEVAALTQAQDVLPTLLDFCGVKRGPGPEFDGLSLAGLLRGATNALPDRTLVVQFGPGFGQTNNSGPQKFASAVMRNQWRLVHGTELYDVQADRAQERDLASAHPDIAADLRRRYETWWTSVETGLRDFVPITLGADAENPVELASSDWQDVYADNAQHIRNAVGGPRGGPWNVNVGRAGTYEITLRRWPFDLVAPLAGNVDPPGRALPIAAAQLRIAGFQRETKTAPDAAEARFTIQLPAGRAQLHAWFQDAEGRDLCGAFFAKVRRTDAKAGAAPDGNSEIRTRAGRSELVLTTTSRLAGAIHSFKWGGREFIDSLDHGRQMQSACSFDNTRDAGAETFNPTEAGSRRDGAGPTTTSRLLALSTQGGELRTRVQPAFWLAPGERSEGQLARNTAVLSDYIIAKAVKVGIDGFPQALDYRVTFTIPAGARHNDAQFEALTGYMPAGFARFWQFNPATGRLEPLDDGPGEILRFVVLATASGSHAMGIYAPPQPQADTAPARYGRWRFARERVVKWNCVFRVRNAAGLAPGEYSYRMRVPFGSLAEVESMLRAWSREETP